MRELYTLLNLRALADSVAQIVELRTANLTASDDFDLLHVGRMERERLLNAAAVSNAANLESLGDTAAVATDHRALKDLSTDSLPLFDPVVNTYGVTDLKLRDLLLHLLINKYVDLGAHVYHLSLLVIPKRSCRAAADRFVVRILT